MEMRNLYAIVFGYSSMNNQMRGTASTFDLQGNSSTRNKCLRLGLLITFALHFCAQFGYIPHAWVQ